MPAIQSTGSKPRNTLLFRWVEGALHLGASIAGPGLGLTRRVNELSGRVVVVSSHFDDAVLSCGGLIGALDECTVLTVFGGSPASWNVFRDWDNRASGFPVGTDVIAARCHEDKNALATLGATGATLDYLDSQYRDYAVRYDHRKLGRAIADAIQRIGAEVAVVPLGLGHRDHEDVAAACRCAMQMRPAIRWFVYQDLPHGYEIRSRYRRMALKRFAAMKPKKALLVIPREKVNKRNAIDHYASQVRAMGSNRVENAFREERYWSVDVT